MSEADQEPATMPGTRMRLTSPAFRDGGDIPTKYTCAGEGLFPGLVFAGIPPTAQSLAVIVDDPDAAGEPFVHLVLCDLPPVATSIPVGLTSLPEGARVGVNDWDATSWGAPCPPRGRHRYFFRLYALDKTLDLEAPTKAQLLQAMAGHVLAEAQLMGGFRPA